MSDIEQAELDRISRLGQSVLEGVTLSAEDADWLIKLSGHQAVTWLIAWANRIRGRFMGDSIDLCAIVNAKSGRCPEDCAFCAQSTHHATDADVYDLLSVEQMADAAARAADEGACRFSIVISGRGVKDGPGFSRICEAISKIADKDGLTACASLGVIDRAAAKRLKDAGLERYHHNIETAPSHYPSICTTHSFDVRLQTIQAAKAAGLEVCSGGIIGMGESPAQRVEMGLCLRDLDVDSVPVNILNPIPGTKLENTPPLSPLKVLQTIAVYRMLMPRKQIRTCGGRERALGDLQPLMYLAGCSGTMTGDYLTTAGTDSAQDRQQIGHLELIRAVR